jgi:membrane protein DedA with SNARE-associated domain
VRLVRAAATSPVVLALLHFHLHREFAGSPLDYLAVAGAAAASWAGVPGPGEPVLIGAALLASHHRLDIGGVVIAAWVGATVGGVVGWAVGLKAGRALLTAPGPLERARLAAVRRGEEIFERWPVAAILVTPAWIAGIHRVRNRVYQPTNAISAAMWAAGIGFGAYLIGPAIVDFVGDLGFVTGGGLILLIVLGVVIELRRRRGRRVRRAAAGESQSAAAGESQSEDAPATEPRRSPEQTNAPATGPSRPS